MEPKIKEIAIENSRFCQYRLADPDNEVMYGAENEFLYNIASCSKFTRQLYLSDTHSITQLREDPLKMEVVSTAGICKALEGNRMLVPSTKSRMYISACLFNGRGLERENIEGFYCSYTCINTRDFFTEVPTRNGHVTYKPGDINPSNIHIIIQNFCEYVNRKMPTAILQTTGGFVLVWMYTKAEDRNVGVLWTQEQEELANLFSWAHATSVNGTCCFMFPVFRDEQSVVAYYSGKRTSLCALGREAENFMEAKYYNYIKRAHGLDNDIPWYVVKKAVSCGKLELNPGENSKRPTYCFRNHYDNAMEMGKWDKWLTDMYKNLNMETYGGLAHAYDNRRRGVILTESLLALLGMREFNIKGKQQQVSFLTDLFISEYKIIFPCCSEETLCYDEARSILDHILAIGKIFTSPEYDEKLLEAELGSWIGKAPRNISTQKIIKDLAVTCDEAFVIPGLRTKEFNRVIAECEKNEKLKRYLDIIIDGLNSQKYMTEIAKDMGVCRKTLYNYLHKFEALLGGLPWNQKEEPFSAKKCHNKVDRLINKRKDQLQEMLLYARRLIASMPLYCSIFIEKGFKECLEKYKNLVSGKTRAVGQYRKGLIPDPSTMIYTVRQDWFKSLLILLGFVAPQKEEGALQTEPLPA